jgi:hypothetical protein
MDYLCVGDIMWETETCHYIDVLKNLQAPQVVNTDIGWPTPVVLVGIVSGTTFQEPAPTIIQSLYFVRAENSAGILSEPTNIVGGPSKALE